jgi:hypothetical protein
MGIGLHGQTLPGLGGGGRGGLVVLRDAMWSVVNVLAVQGTMAA